MNLRNRIFLSFFLITFLGLNQIFAQSVSIRANSERQLIRGIGGINVPGWRPDLTPAQANTAFGNGPGQIGMSIMRMRIDYNKANWHKEVPTAKIAKEKGVILYATPWTPPLDMKTGHNGVVGGHLKPESYIDYAKHLKAFADFMRAEGVPLYAISVQNEPDIKVSYESCDWTGQQFVDFLKTARSYMGDEKLIVGESFQYRKVLTDPILNGNVSDKFDIIGAHTYGTRISDFPYPLGHSSGKEIWMTEHITESNSDADIWPLALDVAYDIHNSFVEGQFNVYTWWYILRFYGMIKEDGKVSKRGYSMAQYSKFIRSGYKRIDATKNPTTDVYVSAYKGKDSLIVVAINRGSASKSINISISDFLTESYEKITTSGSKSLKSDGRGVVPNGTFRADLDAQSVTTFVLAAKASLNVSITAPTESDLFSAPANISIVANATSPNGSVTKVEFRNGNEKIGEATSAPYSYNWTNVAAGTYTLTAVVTDDKGTLSTSSPLRLIVAPPQAPYNGTANAIPGKIEFENFDIGGNGLAYRDDSPGSETSVSFRSEEDVDIETCTDAGGGYNIGYATAGEWLEYTVHVADAGTYDLTLRVAASGEGRTISIAANGNPLQSDIAIPNTAGWQAWEDVKVEGLALEAGQQVIRVTIGAVDYVNLNYMSFATNGLVGFSPNPAAYQTVNVSLHSGILSVVGARQGSKVNVHNIRGDLVAALSNSGGNVGHLEAGILFVSVIDPLGNSNAFRLILK